MPLDPLHAGVCRHNEADKVRLSALFVNQEYSDEQQAIATVALN